MAEALLHMIKLCVGASRIDDLAGRQNMGRRVRPYGRSRHLSIMGP